MCPLVYDVFAASPHSAAFESRSNGASGPPRANFLPTACAAKRPRIPGSIDTRYQSTGRTGYLQLGHSPGCFACRPTSLQRAFDWRCMYIAAPGNPSTGNSPFPHRSVESRFLERTRVATCSIAEKLLQQVRSPGLTPDPHAPGAGQRRGRGREARSSATTARPVWHIATRSLTRDARRRQFAFSRNCRIALPRPTLI